MPCLAIDRPNRDPKRSAISVRAIAELSSQSADLICLESTPLLISSHRQFGFAYVVTALIDYFWRTPLGEREYLNRVGDCNT
jgi:hypothetical protein